MSRSVPPNYVGLHSPLRDQTPLVDGRAAELLGRWAWCFQILAERISLAEQAAAHGRGQADMRTYQRGGDPTSGRLDWDTPNPDDPDQTPPPRLADPEKRALLKLTGRACDRLAYHLAWLERELREPEQKQAG